MFKFKEYFKYKILKIVLIIFAKSLLKLLFFYIDKGNEIL